MSNQNERDREEQEARDEQLGRFVMESAHVVYFAFLTGLGMALGTLAVAMLQRNRDT